MKGTIASPLILILLVPPLDASAQEEPTPNLVVGSSVRLWAPTILPERAEGLVETMDEESLVIVEDGHRVRVPRAAITRIEVSTGRPRQPLKGMIIGAAVFGAMATSGCRGQGSCGTDVGLGVLAGALWGGGIGALVKSDRWREVPAGARDVHLPVQEPGTSSPLAVGSRVRLLAPTVSPGRVEGTLLRLDADSLAVRMSNGTAVSVSREAITRLEMVTGRRRQTLLGMGLGAALGAVLSGTHPCVNEGCYPGFSGEFALLGGVGGALTGAAVGALVKGDHWSGVPLEAVRLTLAPTRGRGVGLSLSLSF